MAPPTRNNSIYRRKNIIASIQRTSTFNKSSKKSTNYPTPHPSSGGSTRVSQNDHQVVANSGRGASYSSSSKYHQQQHKSSSDKSIRNGSSSNSSKNSCISNVSAKSNPVTRDDTTIDTDQVSGSISTNTELPTDQIVLPLKRIRNSQRQKTKASDDSDIIQRTVIDKFFPEVKFVSDVTLRYSSKEESFCQFFIENCNLPENYDKESWWHNSVGLVRYYIGQTRNDKTTAFKYAFYSKLLVQK